MYFIWIQRINLLMKSQIYWSLKAFMWRVDWCQSVIIRMALNLKCITNAIMCTCYCWIKKLRKAWTWHCNCYFRNNVQSRKRLYNHQCQCVSKTPQQLESSILHHWSFILHHPSFILHSSSFIHQHSSFSFLHSSFLHFVTFKLFSLFNLSILFILQASFFPHSK